MADGKSIRHELRTPLNHIIGYSEMLMEDLAAEGFEELHGEFQALWERGKRLLDLVNRLPEGDELQLPEAFGDWRTPLGELIAIVRAVKPRLLGQAAEWMGDAEKVEQAGTRLLGLFEGLHTTPRVGGPAAAEPLVAKGEGADAGPAAAANRTKGHLLVVDDNESNLDLMLRRLTREGYGVTITADGESALELIEQEEFDVVLLDVLMPGINGIEVLKRVRERFSSFQLPIIMVTAKYGSDNIVEALQLGANDYVTKPVDFPVALARISTQLYLRRVTRELAEANERLHRFSYMDGLTGIPNRRHFDEYLAREWGRAQREGEPLSLVLLDVDYFKLFNDNYGHDAGDQALIQVAQTLSRELYRQGDLVARYGGEEFVVVLPKSSAEVAVAVAERLRAAVAALLIPHLHHKSERHVTISLGVASGMPCGQLSAEQLRILADQALYYAKHQGRNRIGCSGNRQRDCNGQCPGRPLACHLEPEWAPVLQTVIGSAG